MCKGEHMREVNRIILHWLGPGDSHDYVSQAAVDGIRSYHINVNGWSDIGYHWLIDRTGVLYKGRPEAIIGAHCYGANTGSMGINCMYGTEDKTVTKETLAALVDLVMDICTRYNITPTATSIIGHKDVLATECPGIIYSYIPWVIASVSGIAAPHNHEPLANPPETNEVSRMQVSYKGLLYDGMLINNQSYLPVSTLAKMLNLKIEWDGKTKIARLT
jgi:hypothetical protein